MLSRNLIICLVCLGPILPVATADEELSPLTINIDFPGGPLEHLLDTIKEQNTDVTPNIIVDDEVRGTKIPPFHLANVHVYELMEALDSIDVGLDVDMLSDNLSAITNRRSVAPASVEIYSVRHLLDPNSLIRFKMDDIATAIRTSWDMISYAGDPGMKVHLETGLLIVQGSKDEQDVVKTVVQRLSDQLQEAKDDLWRRSLEAIEHMKAEHAQELELMKAAHEQELVHTQRLFELELNKREEDYLSLKARHEQLLAEYEAITRGN